MYFSEVNTLNKFVEGGFSVSRETHGGGSRIRPNRMKPSTYIPNEEELAAIKYKKKVRLYI